MAAILKLLTAALVAVGIGVAVPRASLAAFEVGVVTASTLCSLAALSLLVAVIRDARVAGVRAFGGVLLIATGIALELQRLVESLTLFSDPSLLWERPYQAPKVPLQFWISGPFVLIGVAMVVRVGDGTRWRHGAMKTALLATTGGIVALVAVGAAIALDLSIDGRGAVRSVPALSQALLANAVLVAWSCVFLTGYSRAHVPRATAGRGGR